MNSDRTAVRSDTPRPRLRVSYPRDIVIRRNERTNCWRSDMKRWAAPSVAQGFNRLSDQGAVSLGLLWRPVQENLACIGNGSKRRTMVNELRRTRILHRLISRHGK